MEPKISIITVNFNNKLGLAYTINSVLNQTYKNFEFIIIDGGSTDGSKDIIDLYQEKITYSVSETDNGVYSAMNKGIKIAKGEFLLFLNSGDLLANATVLENVENQLNCSFGIIYGDANYLETKNNIIRNYPDELSFNFFLKHNLSHQSTFIRRSLFNEFFFYNEDYKIVSDWEFFIYTICIENVSYKHINLVICNYDTTGVSSILTNHKLMHGEREQVLQKYFPLFIKDYEKIDELSSKRANQFFHIKKYNFAYKILKGMMSFILLFLPKEK